MNEHLTNSNSQSVAPAGNPFRYRAFTVIWIATVVSNIGGWMYSVASGWLMTSLDSNAFIVSMVQVANSLPMFLFAIPAGALADIVNQRRFLIVGESTITIVSAAFAALVWLHLITPASLLLFSFVVTVGSAMTAPAWQSVVAKLVPKADLPSAVAANSVGINVSRAIGPALGGIIVGAVGIAAPFWLDAFSNIGVIAALVWWRAPKKSASALPPEAFGSAIRTGLRYARYNTYLRATLIRTVAFFVFGSAYWALLPLVARTQIAGGPALYGVLLGAIGASAVGGAFLLRRLKQKLGADSLVAAASLGTALATVLFAVARPPGDRNSRQLHRRGLLDRRCGESQCLGASCLARVGSRSWSRHVCDGDVRRIEHRERDLGSTGGCCRFAGGALARGGGRGDRNSPHVAMETTDGREC